METAFYMNDSPIRVGVFVNEATETSIPLETVTALSSEAITVDVLSFYKTDESPFGLDVTSLDGKSQLSLLPYYRFLRYISEQRPDIIHVHPNVTGSFIRVLTSVFNNTSLITTEHNTHENFGFVKNLVNGLTNPLNDVVISNSNATFESFRRWETFLLDSVSVDVRTIYNGVNVEGIREARSGSPVPRPSEFVLGTAGRLVEQKNLVTMLDSLTPLLTEKPEVSLIIVGKGPLEDTLKEKVEEFELGNKVTFAGYLPKRSSVYSFFKSIDAFLFPSIFEGFGVAAVEAMAAGTPVIANDIPVLREVLDEKAIFVNPDNAERFTEVVRSLASDDELRNRLSEEGSEFVARRYSLKECTEQHIELYRSIDRETNVD